MNSNVYTGNIVDLYAKRIFYGSIFVISGSIATIQETGPEKKNFPYILPGFIDAHVHIESSMLVPTEFARLATTHGTVATISDPHEIANVCGMDGVRFMINNAKNTPLHIFFGASPCVPATSFETAGATLKPADIEELFVKEGLLYLSEMMNYPGVLNKNPDVIEKIRIAQKYGRPIDGHAPGLFGEDAKEYASAGITTDHECFTLEEALGKIQCGMKILIREGSAAKNYEALHTLIKTHPQSVMFCSDDKHPDNLIEGHINDIVRRSIAKGYNIFDVLKCACINPVEHYKLPLGTLREKDPADFIIVSDLKDFRVTQTYIKGEKVAENGTSLLKYQQPECINNFNIHPITDGELQLQLSSNSVKVIEAKDGELVTSEIHERAKVESGNLVSDVEKDLLKIAVVNRYTKAKPAIALVKNFGLKYGAIASSVAHDSHNIIAVGVDDKSMCEAINAIISCKGGISAFEGSNGEVLSLPVAGIMSDREGSAVARQYSRLDQRAKSMGSNLTSPFMTLSFMALLVIPSLKLSDCGLFDGETFDFTSLEI
ncbi:MAG: adenine deaminase [Chlamydiota bacterium]|nr:adenine deaminase [Chlamydiota bacterium]